MNAKEAGRSFIEHYGVRGMRWGVRRTPAQLGKGGKKSDEHEVVAPKPKPGEVTTKITRFDRKGNPHPSKLSNLSDTQLKKLNERMTMEQNYARLTAKPPGFMGAAKKFATDIAVNVAKTQLTALANEQASKQIKNLMGTGKAPVPKLPKHLRVSNLPRPDALARLG